jgi:hypothetical protein
MRRHEKHSCFGHFSAEAGECLGGDLPVSQLNKEEGIAGPCRIRRSCKRRADSLRKTYEDRILREAEEIKERRKHESHPHT